MAARGAQPADAKAVDVWRFRAEPCSGCFVDDLLVRLGTERLGAIDLDMVFAEG
jgi:hypothetical protein